MPTITIPDDARYALVICTPTGTADENLRVEYDDRGDMDADMAALLLAHGQRLLVERANAERTERARARLLAPLPARTMAHTVMDASPAETPVVAEAGHEERIDLGVRVGGDEADGAQ